MIFLCVYTVQHNEHKSRQILQFEKNPTKQMKDNMNTQDERSISLTRRTLHIGDDNTLQFIHVVGSMAKWEEANVNGLILYEREHCAQDSPHSQQWAMRA